MKKTEKRKLKLWHKIIIWGTLNAYALALLIAVLALPQTPWHCRLFAFINIFVVLLIQVIYYTRLYVKNKNKAAKNKTVELK
ncbi:hypothetical protein S100390_v1c09380 [Spiroplasma sp. NBRC 100390]|uniref:hypothetical protein n=1 Tax=unclassified Spiroplasma TaxID=2637901 RepID=UPI00089285B2|nr:MULTISPECIES: hypothetical protein [unclassified Spiroplasma]AOX44274.1 hypothetical protein STU14_v1c09380 [Spiroplasma sp. TU-14]APE13744.1 hypothetical protein S100390_v1c09380 [Spiroplasma sp. NBRC 100390]